MNTLRSNSVKVEIVNNLNDTQKSLWMFFMSHKGKAYTADELKDLLGEAMPKDVKPVVKALLDAGLIEKGEENTVIMPRPVIEDVREEQQLAIGGKIHTTLTMNSDELFYDGDEVTYPVHSLSWQHRVGLPTWKGKVFSYHVNEEGFLYLYIREDEPTTAQIEKYDLKKVKGAPFNKDGKVIQKRVAKKSSLVERITKDIPSSPKNIVEYKKAAEGFVVKRDGTAFRMPAITGNQVIHFSAQWSPTSKEIAQILQQFSKEKAFKSISIHEVDADENAAECAKHKLRVIPLILVVKEGKVVKTVKNFSRKELAKALYADITSVFSTKEKEVTASK